MADGRARPHADTGSDDLPSDGLDIDLSGSGTERMIRVTVDAADAELVSDRFWQLGVRAVTEVDLPDGRVEVSSSVGNDLDAIDRAGATLDPSWTWRVDEVSTDLGDDWRAFARPIWYADDLVVVPAWLAEADLDRPASVTTLIEPASAFGLGDHPTTRSSMTMIAELLREPTVPVDSVLDVGCGTGALAILAAQLGAGRVRAIDVADAAISATRSNAALNGVADRVDTDTTSLADVEGSFDLVVANILAPILVALADDLRRLVAPGGSLVISGVLEARHRHVLDALRPMRPVASIVDDGWITIRLMA